MRPGLLHQIEHGTHFEHRLRGIDRGDGFADRFFERARRHIGADQQSVIGPFHLPLREVNHRQRIDVVEGARFDSPHHAEDFPQLGFAGIARVHAKSFADWIFAGKNFLGEELVDYRNGWGRRGVAFVEGAAAKKRHLEGREIIASDHFQISAWHIAR